MAEKHIVLATKRVGTLENASKSPKGYRLCMEFFRKDSTKEWVSIDYVQAQDEEWDVSEFEKVNFYLTGALPRFTIIDDGKGLKDIYVSPHGYQFVQSVNLANTNVMNLGYRLDLEDFIDDLDWKGNFVIPDDLSNSDEEMTEIDSMEESSESSGDEMEIDIV